MGQKKMHVLGSLNVDIVARVAALPSPGETVQGGDLAVMLGGKGANQAVAAACAGADVAMFGAIGTQDFGLDFRALMAGYGVDMAGVAVLNGASGAALIAVDGSGENAITVSPGANGRVGTPPPVTPGCTLLAQMETPPEVTARWFQAGRASGCLTILNAAPALAMPEGLLAVTDILVVNETELATYAPLRLQGGFSDQAIIQAARTIHQHDSQWIIVTLGARGAMAISGTEVIAVPAHPAQVRDTTGAGDCFCGVLAACLTEGATLADAMRLASVAAAISVTRDGAAPSMPTRAEIEAATSAA